MSRHRLFILALGLIVLAACSGGDPEPESTTTAAGLSATSSPQTSDTPPQPSTDPDAEAIGDDALVAVLATEFEGGMLDPLPMSAETAQCAAGAIVSSMEGGEGMSLEDYLESRGTEVEDETVELVLASYFECSESKVVGDALADDLIESIGFPADEGMRGCLSERLDSADEVRGIMGLEGGTTDPVSVLEGCVGLGDVMSVEIAGLTAEQHTCLNRRGDDVLAAMLRAEEDDMTRPALTAVLEACGLSPGSGAE
ncbi:MAG: hypothetical protein GEU79_03010 [Acidimicrobiia bacterium]|nr:hypothetical protein [Acidimicrobiia bacterium]